MKLQTLWQNPEINPKTRKALSIPLLNVFDPYGRIFHLAWLGFFASFLSWFAFPPLLSGTVKEDLKLTAKDISNNNICGLAATLVARVILGPLCDRFGPRWTMAGVLIVGTVPTALIPCVTNVSGLHAIRFFIGLLGGSFVPCQVWTTVFFDTSIVGTANSLVGGWGNAGGGVAFFVMPAIVADLANDGYSLHKTWGYAFVIGPMIILLFVAALVIIFGQDCPEGKWADRTDVLGIGIDVTITNVLSVPMSASNEKELIEPITSKQVIEAFQNKDSNLEKEEGIVPVETQMGKIVDLEDIIENPKPLDLLKVGFHWRTMLVALAYLTTFGGELAVESVMTALYKQHSGNKWSQQLSGDWASMLGLLNVVSRPVGGLIGDFLYRFFKTTKAKKFWMIFCGFMEGLFLLWIGLKKDLPMAGLIVAMAIMDIFMEMGNGANFCLVPQINPHHTGIVSGITGAFGNLGGIFFSLVFRYQATDGVTNYFKSFWIIGIVMMIVNFGIAFIPVREDRPEGYKEKNDSEVDKV
ncbi:hypothetical protein PACTADRAFT_80314 [Pachysolen tannophilus NRRL Y-2460]|uniref:Nitrate/nitrite transporter n=1 Tax=Pachysolen tannophilus NRRL Y-2460 TaxID=669874 RepID=A0A1E4TX12_PACTA|nr:hypothetical protein PACTADRAFT_80314 [Pachysolen tannophilus NRRL Y-2460]